jgi:hypothetical protein
MSSILYRKLRLADHPGILRKIFLFMNATVLLIYAMVRIMVGDYSYEGAGDLLVVLWMIGTGSALALLVYAGFALVTVLEAAQEGRIRLSFRPARVFWFLGLLFRVHLKRSL